MKILTLIIKQTYFDMIMSGEKKEEFREIRPNTNKKYCELDEDGFALENEKGIIPRHYDAIQFYVGYNKNRASALVEVKSAEVNLVVDEKGDFIPYVHEGEEYLAAEITYKLGNIINKSH